MGEPAALGPLRQDLPPPYGCWIDDSGSARPNGLPILARVFAPHGDDA